MNRLAREEIEFITRCLKQGRTLRDSYRHIVPFEITNRYEFTCEGKDREKDIPAHSRTVGEGP